MNNSKLENTKPCIIVYQPELRVSAPTAPSVNDKDVVIVSLGEDLYISLSDELMYIKIHFQQILREYAAVVEERLKYIRSNVIMSTWKTTYLNPCQLIRSICESRTNYPHHHALMLLSAEFMAAD